MAKCDVAKNMRSAGISVTNEIISLREAGIQNYLCDEPQIEISRELVRLYYTGKCNKDVLDKFINTFKDSDNTFSDDLTNEIQALAGIVLCEMILHNEWEDTISLVEVYASMYDFLGYKSICDDVYNTMIEDFDNRRIDLRENISIEENKVTALAKTVNFNVTEDGVEYTEKVADNLNNVVKKVNEIAKFVSSMSQTETLNMKILHEDSQMLWWLLTGTADVLEQKYSEMDCKQAAILAGADLAKRVTIFPGPYAAKQLLSKVLEFASEKDKFTFDSFIEELDESVIESVVNTEEIDTPVLYALKKKAENGSGCWKNVFLKKFSKTKPNYTVLEMAYETYLECLGYMD